MNKFLATFQGSSQARIITLAFLLTGFGAVSYQLFMRTRALSSMMLTTLAFLVVRDAIKIQKATFGKSLQEIEQHLIDGDWPFAHYRVRAVMKEFDELIREVF